MNSETALVDEKAPKPTTLQLLGDAISYASSNFTVFLLYGGGLVVVFKLVGFIQRLIGIYGAPFLYDLINWPIYFLSVFLKAIFAYNVHRYVLLDQNKFSFALGKTFWLFFAAVLAIEFAFWIPEELFNKFVTYERLLEFHKSQTLFFSMDPVLLFPLGKIVVSALVLLVVARFLTIPPSIVANEKVALDANLAIGRALYWPIIWGLLLLNLVLNLYALLVGLGTGSITMMMIMLESEHVTLISLAANAVLLAPLSFFSVLLGATFTSAAFIRGSRYLGLPDSTRN